MITQPIKLNLIPGGILPRIKASQYDSGSRTLKFKIYNGVQEFTIPTDSTVSIRGTKSDHTGFQYECEYSGNEVTAQITDQMTVSPGEVLAELVITKDDERIATGNFIFENEEAALKDDVIISKTDIPAIERLDDIVDLVEEDAERAESAKTSAETAATQASQSAQTAVTSASQASTSATNAASSASAAATSESNAATSETNAGAYATQAASSAAAALASQQAAAQSATNASASESNAATSETNAANSATAASASATAAAASEANASASETAAATSASSAATSATNAASSEANAAASESNAAASESNASASETAAAGSATSAATSATNAASSEANAANSETLARKWAVGDSGSGTATPSDTNNAYYWAQVAQRASGGGLTIEVVAELPTTDISVTKIYLVPSTDPETQNVKDEYVNLDGTTSGWELIGSTKIDLSGYYTKTQIDEIIQGVKDYADSKVAELKTYVQENYTPTTMLKDTVGWTGKNLLSYPYFETSKTYNGITWTVNEDGSITANGTATANAVFNIHKRNPGEDNDFALKNGDYILSGCPSGGSSSTYVLAMSITKNGTVTNIATDRGNGVQFTADGDDSFESEINPHINVTIVSGTTVNNLTFYPMIRRADIADDTWEPYHESVEEEIGQLTEDVAEISTKIATIKATYDENTALYAHAVGDIIYLNEHFYKVTAAIAVGDTIATGTNITADTGLAIDTPIYVSNLPNS